MFGICRSPLCGCLLLLSVRLSDSVLHTLLQKLFGRPATRLEMCPGHVMLTPRESSCQSQAMDSLEKLDLARCRGAGERDAYRDPSDGSPTMSPAVQSGNGQLFKLYQTLVVMPGPKAMSTMVGLLVDP